VKKITVYGPGCRKCHEAEELVKRVVAESGAEFGSNRCLACQQMAVVLDALRASQGEKLQVEFLDVMENPELGEPYKIALIPTQILFNPAGKEIFRHTGFFSHDDILAKFRELGVKL
jgi:thioredoxin 1